MEIKDIQVTVDGEEVRGGSDIVQVGAQLGFNKALGLSHNAGVFNHADTSVKQDASQSLAQGAKLSDVDVEQFVFSATNSIFGGRTPL
jgi:hypothetical protein